MAKLHWNSSQASILKAGQDCATYVGLNWTTIETCFSGDEGKAIDQSFATRTLQLNPPHLYTPWVVLDGNPIILPEDDDKPDPLDHLLELVCANISTTPRPAGCSGRQQL